MKRGVMVLTCEEISEALNSLPGSQQNSPLYSKLLAGSESKSKRTQIQFSDDELEILLDSIGFPEEGETIERKSLRIKIQTFLLYIRKGDLVIE